MGGGRLSLGSNPGEYKAKCDYRCLISVGGQFNDL